jgi:hypothetical protein
MINKILILLAMAGMIVIHHSAFAQTKTTRSRTDRAASANPQSTTVLKPAPAKVTPYDSLRYEFITAPMELGPYSTLEISAVNCEDTRDEYVQIEVHAAVVSGAAASPKLLKRSELIKVPPQNIFVFKHYRRKDGTDGNLHNHWVRIKTSSEYLIPKLTHHSQPDPSQSSLIRTSYLPGDFAVYTRYPFKRIR